MATQGSEDKIAEILRQAYPAAAASPEFKEKLLLSLSAAAVAPAPPPPKAIWQQPLAWATAGVGAAIAIALVVYFVVFQPTPLTVTTIDATSIQATAATLNADLEGLAMDDSVDISFQWGTTSDYGHETTPEMVTEDGSVAATLTGLAPNTTYHFRVKAEGHDGVVYGPDKSFTTGIPPSVITDDASKIEASSARLNGKLSSPGSADSARISFVWGTTAGGPYTETTPEEKGAGAFSFELEDLHPGTAYYYRAKAVSGDASVYGDEMSFTTLTIPPSVTTNDATDVGTTSARLNTDLTSLGTATSVSVSFEWGTTSGSYTNETIAEVETTTRAFHFDLGGLTPGTTYYFRAKAVGDGTSFGLEKSFTTLTIPPSITTGSATGVHPTSATLNGNLDSLGTADSASVSFEWGRDTAYGNETTVQIITATGSFNAGLTNLSPRTTYHFRAKAIGDGVAYGADMEFTTPPPQKTWYLSDNTSGAVRVMYDSDNSQTPGIVRLRDSELQSQIWRADQSSSDTTYPAGNWTIQLTLSDFEKSHTDNIEIGTWDGNEFTSYGVSIIKGLRDDDDKYVVPVSIAVRSFTVPSGGYVAVRITVTSSSQLLKVHVGGSQSYVKSPAYPEPTAPAVTTNAATAVEQTTATMNGNQIEVDSKTSAGNLSAVLPNLSPNTTCHFRAKAVGDGTNFGVDMVFTTPP